MVRLLCLLACLVWGCCYGGDLNSSNAWIPTSSPPVPIQKIITLDDGSVLAVCNAQLPTPHSVAFKYQQKTNEWQEAQGLPDNVVGIGATLIKLSNGSVLGLGLVEHKKVVAYVLNPDSMSWSPTGALPSDFISYDRTAVALSSGEVLIMGSEGVHNVGWLYKYKTNSWSRTQPPPPQTAGTDYATEIGDGRVLVIARDTSLVVRWIGLLYQPVTDSWTLTGEIPSSMRGEPNSEVKMPDGSILLIGFQQYPGAETISILYNQADNKWTKVGELPQPSEIHGASLLNKEGVVLITAKSLLTGRITTLLYSPAQREWRMASSPPKDYLYIRLMWTLPDGTLFAIGNKNNVQSDELIYSPILNTWTKSRSLPDGAHYASVLTWNDSAILFVTNPKKDLDGKFSHSFFQIP